MPEPITREWVEEQKVLCELTPPAPWEVRRNQENGQGGHETRIDSNTGEWHRCEYFCFGWDPTSLTSRGQPHQPGHEHKSDPIVLEASGYDGSGDLIASDEVLTFIAAARTGYPRVLQDWLRLEEQNRKLREALRGCVEVMDDGDGSAYDEAKTLLEEVRL